MSKANIERFNAEAAEWDKNPDVIAATDGALKAILDKYPNLRLQHENGTATTQGLDVLEIGCGTGLLSLRIAPYIRSIVAVDAADGMINALSLKLQRPGMPDNVTAIAMLLEDPEDMRLPPGSTSDASGPRRKFDLIISHLVLHHIPDLEKLLNTMFGCLKADGTATIALTDFEDYGPNARKFHPESKMEGVERHGIRRSDFSTMIERAGFGNVEVDVGWIMRKHVERYPGEWGQKKPSADEMGDEGFAEQDFPFLICTGTRL